jgi:hypothetical protein
MAGAGSAAEITNEQIQAAVAAYMASSPATSERRSAVVERSAKITEWELNHIRTALMTPQKKPDPIAAIVSVMTASFFFGKTMIDSHGVPQGWNLFAGFCALALILVVIGRFLTQRSEKYPFHEQALKDVDRLIREARGEPPAAAPIEDARVHESRVIFRYVLGFELVLACAAGAAAVTTDWNPVVVGAGLLGLALPGPAWLIRQAILRRN